MQRVLVLLRVRLASQWRGGARGGMPVAALLAFALIAGVPLALVRDALPPYAYALFALSLVGALVSIPLLGELGELLRSDEAGDWIRAQPVRTVELRAARTLHLLVLLYSLSFAALLPCAVLAPAGADLGARVTLVFSGLGLVTFLAAALLFLQSVLGGRAEALLILLQTALVIGVVFGLVFGLHLVPALADVEHPEGWLRFFPPSWFASPLGRESGALPLAVGLGSLALLFVLPSPGVPPRRRGEPVLALLLRPARRLATRFWVRPDERGVFDLVYDALPREREVVLRTYPMIGIPLAFLVAAAAGPDDGQGRRDVLALLLFTAGIYLPILLTHVPASATPGAAWLLRAAPVPEGAVVDGTTKALAVRFLLPLYVVLAALAWSLAGPDVALRLAVPGFLLSLLILRRLYPVCVSGPPLSTAPDELRTDLDWFGLLGGYALVLTLGALLANRYLETLLAGALLALGLAAIELGMERGLRRRLG